MIKIILMAVLLVFGIILYACFMAAHTSDQDAERVYREYMEWKERRKKWKD
jgi:hypothetical protein